MLENLLVIDPRQRYNVEQAMQHPYLRDYFNENDITPLRQQPFYDEPAGLTTNQLRGKKLSLKIFCKEINFNHCAW